MHNVCDVIRGHGVHVHVHHSRASSIARVGHAPVWRLLTFLKADVYNVTKRLRSVINTQHDRLYSYIYRKSYCIFTNTALEINYRVMLYIIICKTLKYTREVNQRFSITCLLALAFSFCASYCTHRASQNHNISSKSKASVAGTIL